MMKYIKITKHMKKGIIEFMTGTGVMKMMTSSPDVQYYFYPEYLYISAKTYTKLKQQIKEAVEQQFKYTEDEFKIGHKVEDRIRRFRPNVSKAIKPGYVMINHVELNKKVRKMEAENKAINDKYMSNESNVK